MRTLFKRSQESIDRLNRLIEDLLLFSSPRAAETVDVDLGAVAAETVSLAKMGLGDRALAGDRIDGFQVL